MAISNFNEETTGKHVRVVYVYAHFYIVKVKSMQRSGTEATRTPIKPSKPTHEITNTNSQNKKITYGQPSEQLFPKRWPLSNQTELK